MFGCIYSHPMVQYHKIFLEAFKTNGGNSTIKSKLLPSTLLRKPYRSLLNGSRGYAAFDEKAVTVLVEELRDKAPILDPMSGYGSLLDVCSRKGIPSVSVEIAAPLYLWQLIRNPSFSGALIHSIDSLQKKRSSWPITRTKVEVSDDWFVPESLRILQALLKLATSSIDLNQSQEALNPDILGAAILAPFCGRLACQTQSANNPTWVKKGGMTVFESWQSDFSDYLTALRTYLIQVSTSSVCGVTHRVIFGDCRYTLIKEAPFRSMVTSPPYPNRVDYHCMFEPEMAFCDYLGISEIKPVPPEKIIGSTVVRNTLSKPSSLPSIVHFLDHVKDASKLTKAAADDNKVYYYPYYSNYFSALVEAYGKVATQLASEFSGYIILQNNYFRDKEIPLALIISDIWRDLGFQVQEASVEEVFHVGTMNPRARGRKAKQSLYTLRVTR